jgi:V/A-type H+-transporting ATPase subunit I
LILLFYVRWNDVGSVFNVPFDFIGSFTDVLSYIRLFAVGLASYYIAESFNNMGYMIMHISPYLIVLTILVLLFGHLLNIGLALMGVLVHGIRLNTLEFSNHMELEWSGTVYKPFTRKHKKDFRNITHKH